MATSSPGHPTSWGYAGVFPGEFGVWNGDVLLNKLRFAADHGFSGTGLGLGEAADPARAAVIADFVAEHDLALTTHYHAPFFTDSPSQLTAAADRFLEDLARLRDPLRLGLLVINAGPYHRFMREPSLAFQLERLAHGLRPIAQWCAANNLPVGIENHVDYWAEDLVGLCREVPGLGIFLDTGNCVQLGERPVEAARIAAPHVIGTHFKDFRIEPSERELKTSVLGAAFGDGDVELERIYHILLEGCPDPARLRMEFELIPPREGDPWDALDRSKRFVERLSGATFRYPTRP